MKKRFHAETRGPQSNYHKVVYRLGGVVAILCAGALALRGQVTVHYINVGQAASALVEFRDGAVLIDAGGEDTSDNPNGEVYRRHLIDYLNGVFANHPDWDKTIEGIIISHPHKDHTKLLMDVMNKFTVHTLIDNGAECGSGFNQLKQAREFASKNQINHMAVNNRSIHAGGMRVDLIPDGGPDAPQILLLSGRRNCLNANNDSIAVRIVTNEATMLFTGDSENEDSATPCATNAKKCEPELSMLKTKYAATGLLKADLYHVAHHGSDNGTTAEFLQAVAPAITVISAGDAFRAKPTAFHAWQFGHPRDKAVNPLIANTSRDRDQSVDVQIFEAGNTANAKKISPPKTISMTKAVYCTCWDGDIKVAYAAGVRTPTVTTDGFHPVVPMGDRPKMKK